MSAHVYRPAAQGVGRWAVTRLLGRLFATPRLPLFAVLWCVTLVFVGVFADQVAPYTPTGVDFRARMLPPAWLDRGSLAHPLGTDQLGRDLLSMLIAGARISLLTASIAIIFAGTLGVMLGLAAGYLGGLIEASIMRLVDAFLAVPFILMALAFVSALGSGVFNLIIVMILTNWARYARLARSEAISIKQKDYVTLARIAGVGRTRILLRHILPNAMASVTALAVLDVGRVIILESSLSYLGLGVQSPDVSWGLILAGGKTYLAVAWWLTALPGIVIMLTVMSFNSVGEWIKRRVDPLVER
jgi:peptide/nickel transport system permease protein